MKLAINGGEKIRTRLFPNQSAIGREEKIAVHKVLESTVLTGYKANVAGMYGGEQVQSLENEWSEYFKGFSFASGHPYPLALNSIAVNSCTSGLFVACGAIGLEPGDEVIVTPYSMTCSATIPLAWGAVPVFADIDPVTFNLDPVDVEKKITKKTRAIIVVDLFGMPYDKRINEIAKKHGLRIIEDAAQAPGAMRVGDYAGTLGDIGVFSFNQGKHISAGEGGMICTYNREFAERCRLLINHAEAVINDDRLFSKEKNTTALSYAQMFNTFGFNLRLTEIQAAMIRTQLKRFQRTLEIRKYNVRSLIDLLMNSPVKGIKLYYSSVYEEHAFYVLPLGFDTQEWGVSRERVIAAVKAELMPCAGRENEGVTIGAGYITPICDMPLFATGPFIPIPNCRKVQDKELIIMHRFIGPNAESGDMEDVANAFIKVWENRGELV